MSSAATGAAGVGAEAGTMPTVDVIYTPVPDGEHVQGAYLSASSIARYAQIPSISNASRVSYAASDDNDDDDDGGSGDQDDDEC
jgi:3-hydroxyisobutyrate dehydrogenase-like beta-hydroxyacid dehydrogenase